MSTVLLLNPPAETPVLRDNYCGFTSKASYLWPPIDLLVQSGWLHGEFELLVLDAVAEDLEPLECLNVLRQRRPDAVFFLSCAATFQDDADFARQVHACLPGAYLAVGLGHMVIDPCQYLQRYPWVNAVLWDYASSGLRDVLAGRDVHPGLVTGDDTPPEGGYRPSARLSYPVPQHHLFPLGHYAMPIGWKGPFTTVLTSLGCAHQCTFCSGSAIRYRKRPAGEVLHELARVRELGIRNLFFVDYTFTTSRRYVLDLCGAMERQRMPFRWTCFARVDHITDELLVALKGAGCDLIQMGVESGDDGILERYRKGFTVAQVREAFRACRRHGLKTLAFFIIGLPGETVETVRRTVDLSLELDTDLASFAMPTPDPGTSVLEEAIRSGRVDREPRQVVSTVSPTIGTDQLSVEQIQQLRADAIRRFYLRPSFMLRQVRSLESWADVQDRARNAISLFLKN